ncbi:MAG: dephospho-CoA kinase [Pseudomonadota bacterium]
MERRSTITHLPQKSKPVTIAVTGNAGSGKTTVCDHLKSLGLPVIILDALAREVVGPGSPALLKISHHFGKRILTDDGFLNRPALRHIILEDETQRHELEKILHPEIISLMHRRISEAGERGAAIVIIEVPLLFELDMRDRFDLVLLVTAESRFQVERLAHRDKVTPGDAAALIKAQMPDIKKREYSDFIINNNGCQSELINSVDRFHQIVYQKIVDNGKSA